MKKILTIVLTVIFVSSMMLLTGCPNPMSPVDLTDLGEVVQPSIDNSSNGDDPAIKTGFTFIIPRYASWIGVEPVSRAFAFNDSIEITVYDSDFNEVLFDIWTPNAVGVETISGNVMLDPGTGYSVVVDIFNHVMSTTVPVVSGTSADFDIENGVVTQVPVICRPNNPTVAAADTQYDFSVEVTPLDGNYMPTATGGELWYEMIVPASGYFEVDIDMPVEVIAYYAAFFGDGTIASGFGSATAGPGPDTLSFPGTPGETYYFAMICCRTSTGTIDGSVRWSEVTPILLRDVDVPDAQLRSLMQDYTGKEFSVSGSTPENQITDIDLAQLSGFLTCTADGHGEYTGITNLTGLEYCTGLQFLLLNSNDLSGADFSVLQNMLSLTALDMWGCNLQDLSMIDYLGNPNFHHLKVAGNPGVSLADITSVTAAKFPFMQRLAFGGFDSGSDGIADDVSASDWTEIVNLLATHTNLTELTLCGDLDFTDTMFNELVTNVITPRASSWLWLDISGNQNLTDVSALSGLSSLYWLNIDATLVNNLAPIWDLYNTDGAFTSTINANEIRVNYCNLELWPGSPDRTIVDNLLAADPEIHVNYQNGNQLVQGTILTNTDVPDSELRSAFEDATGKTFGEITDIDLEALSSFKINGDDYLYTDITGIEYLTGVTWLEISSTAVTDFSPISTLTGLHGLSVDGNDLTDISFVSGMSSLIYLDVAWNEVSDISAIANLTNLETLDIRNNHIGDLTPLEGLENLEFFRIEVNPVDVSDLAILTDENFPELWGLKLDNEYDMGGGTPPINLDADLGTLSSILGGLNNLTYLYMDDFYFSDAQFSTFYTQVLQPRALEWTELKLPDSDLTDTSLLLIANLINLYCLDLTANNITDLSIIEGLTSELCQLLIAENEFTDLTPLQAMLDDGAFPPAAGEEDSEIDIRNCNLDLTPDSSNLNVVSNLLSEGVIVQYEEGNFLTSP
ncbi:MAG: leucine-rich repeat domain-containing protein [Spirochaetales bacterium]|nr:leucine-rich repeat domain-containing protein [Spirochaetales bacterium]